MISITEQALLRHLECPMRSKSLVSTSEMEPPLLACAESTARWLIDELANRRPPSPRETRGYFETVWQQTSYFQARHTIARKDYEAALMKTARVCRRLRDILFRCEILAPVLPYELQVGGMVLTGEYAVLRSSRRKTHAFALYLRHGGMKLRPLVPDVVSFARRLDLGDRWIASGNSSVGWGIKSIAVMHYWVTQDLQVEHQPERHEAAEVLEGAAGVLASPPFPVPGPHCRDCATRACRPDCLGAATLIT